MTADLSDLPEALTLLEPAPPQAGLWRVSLPWPECPPQSLALGGAPTHSVPLGAWPGREWPRRQILTALASGAPPEEAALGVAGAGPVGGPLPQVRAVLHASSPYRADYWETHALELAWGEASLGLMLGLRTGGEVHWWEACRLVVLEETPLCTTVEMGGAIAHHRPPFGDDEASRAVRRSFVHRHNWLNGRLHVRFYRNGVCEIHAHHINSKFFDDGLPLEDVVPVVGFRLAGELPPAGPWVGGPARFRAGGVGFDLGDAARLATPEQPGAWMHGEPGWLVWQPYAGVELFGGRTAEEVSGDAWIIRPETRSFPRGMARTLRFSLSLSAASPSIARYIAPASWYGACREFSAEPLEPVPTESAAVDEAREWLRAGAVPGGFEEGAIPRYQDRVWGEGTPRHEAGWDGEVPYAQFLDAWHSGCGEAYARALRSAWHFTDVAVDHAVKLVRMHGNPPHAFSLPMNRMQGTLAAYLETGVPFLLETARAVVANAHWQHLNSWPRHTVGRDACYVRGAVLLYRYFGESFYLEIAREGAVALAQSQGADGSFGDQGGGTGLHQRAGYLNKPWMGLLGLQGVIDYLEHAPAPARDAALLEGAVRRFADWLLAEQWERDGWHTWSYEHAFLGERRIFTSATEHRPLPTRERWHQETLARILGFCTFRFGDPAYLQAWRASFIDALHPPGTHTLSSNAVAPVLEYLPWLAMKLGALPELASSADPAMNRGA